MDQELNPPSTQALNCLTKGCLGFQVDYLLCDDYGNERKEKMVKFTFVKFFQAFMVKNQLFISFSSNFKNNQD